MARTHTRNGRRTADRRRNQVTPVSTAQHPASGPRRHEWSNGQYDEALLTQLYSFGFGPNGPLRTVGLTSAKRGEGVTTVACRLALYAADCHGLHVLLIDGNHASPKLHSVFRIKERPGLLDLLTEDGVSPADCVHDLSSKTLECWPESLRQAIRRGRGSSRRSRSSGDTPAPKLSILPAGSGDPVAKSGVNFHRDHSLDRLGDRFDLVIVDLPAVESPTGCGFALSDLGGVLFVLKAESTTDVVAQKGLRQLGKNGGNVLGVVFNQRRIHLPLWIDKKLGG